VINNNNEWPGSGGVTEVINQARNKKHYKKKKKKKQKNARKRGTQSAMKLKLLR